MHGGTVYTKIVVYSYFWRFSYSSWIILDCSVSFSNIAVLPKEIQFHIITLYFIVVIFSTHLTSSIASSCLFIARSIFSSFLLTSLIGGTSHLSNTSK